MMAWVCRLYTQASLESQTPGWAEAQAEPTGSRFSCADLNAEHGGRPSKHFLKFATGPLSRNFALPGKQLHI